MKDRCLKNNFIKLLMEVHVLKTLFEKAKYLIREGVAVTLGNILYLLSFIIPKKDNLWIFGAWFGKRYSDNPRSVFEYVKKNHPDINAIWLTRNKNILKIIRKYGFKAKLTYSIAGIWIALRARVGIINQSIGDINLFASGKLKIIQLWHGTPLKKIMFDTDISFWKPHTLKRLLFPFIDYEFSKQMFIVPSETVRNIFSGAFRVSSDKIKVIGYPRNDVFFNFKPKSLPLIAFIESFKKERKVGIYLPTHRLEGDISFTDNMVKNLSELNSKLENRNIFLIVKYHYYHQNLTADSVSGLKNIKIISDEDITGDIYSILPLTDFLVTDYSSIYFDYLLLDKPIIFFPFDIDNYLKVDREFYFDYDEITPGPKATQWSDLATKIEEALIIPDKYAVERKRLCEMFNKYHDGSSSQRVVNEIIKFLS